MIFTAILIVKQLISFHILSIFIGNRLSLHLNSSQITNFTYESILNLPTSKRLILPGDKNYSISSIMGNGCCGLIRSSYIQEVEEPKTSLASTSKIFDSQIKNQSGIFGKHSVDVVQKSDMKKLKHRLSGVVMCLSQNGDIQTGTGILISKDLVLTCAHVIYDEKTSKTYHSILFFPGQYGDLIDCFEVAQSEYPKQYAEKKQGFKYYDYALLKLAKKVKETQFIELSSNISQADKLSTISIHGYPESKFDHLDKKPHAVKQYGLTKTGFIQEILEEAGYILHKISTEKGQSGAAVIRQDGRGNLTIIGIHVGCYEQNQNKKLNLTKMISTPMINRLKTFSEKMDGDMFKVYSQLEQIKSHYELKIKQKEDNIKILKTELINSNQQSQIILKQVKNKYEKEIIKRQENIKKLQQSLKVAEAVGSADINKIREQYEAQIKQRDRNIKRLQTKIRVSEQVSQKRLLNEKEKNKHQQNIIKKLTKQLQEAQPLLSSLSSDIQQIQIPLSKFMFSNMHEDPDNYFKKGDELFKAKQYGQAIKCYLKAIKINPEHIDAHTHLALTYQHTNDPNDLQLAIQQYKKVIELDPECQTTYNCLGFAYAKTGQWEDAIRSYRKAIELDPKYKTAYDNLIKVQWQKVSQFVLEKTLEFLARIYPVESITKRTVEALKKQLQIKTGQQ